MFKAIEEWGLIETVGDLIGQVNDIGDVDPKTPIMCNCDHKVILRLMENPETKERYMEIEDI